MFALFACASPALLVEAEATAGNGSSAGWEGGAEEAGKWAKDTLNAAMSDTDFFNGKKFELPEIGMPSKDALRVPESGSFDGVLSGVSAFVKGGVQACGELVEGALSSFMPDTKLPEQTLRLAGIVVFVMLLSMFVSVPRIVLFVIVMALA